MYPIDNNTSSTTLPPPKPVGIPGFFTAGTVGGVPATIVEADWLNMVQQELQAVLAAANITPAKTVNNQVIQAILWLIANNTRQRLTGPLDLYVNGATGSDTNTGLTPSTAFATLQAAWNQIIARYDCGGHYITVHIADGTYSPLMCFGTPIGANGAPVYFTGNVANPANVIIAATQPNQNAVYITEGAVAVLNGMRLTTTGSGQSSGIYMTGGYCLYGNVIFGPCTYCHVMPDVGSLMEINANYSIAGGAQYHFYSAQGSMLGTAPQTQVAITLSGTPTFTGAFARASLNATMQWYPSFLSFTGSANGPRYFADTGGQIYVNGGGANYFPGSTAGSVDATSYGSYKA